jgi:hypothetical protein
MNKEIIEKYGIDFQNRIDDGVISKFPDANCGYITLLLFEWNSADIDDHGLLADIDEALANPESEIENGSTAIDIIIHQDVVDFYPDGVHEIYSMPTTDFREVVVGRRDFLLTPPLNGTKIWLSPISICRLAMAKLKKILNKKY